MTERPDCELFDAAVAELALEILRPDERDAMLAHAAGCDRCRTELELLTATGDRMTLLAPEAEPPIGFEQRILRAMVGRRALWPIVLAAAAALVVFVAGFVAGRVGDQGTTSAPFRSASLVDQRGHDHGSVVLTADNGVILTMSLRALDEGTYRCTVQRRDGTTTEIASWPIGATGAGVWAVPLSGPFDDIRVVSLIEGDGTTVATAKLN